MIDGVKVEDLRVIPDDRGYLMEMFRSDSPDFQKFGQVYMTVVYPGVVKAWHYHKKQTDNFVCVAGMAKVALTMPARARPPRARPTPSSSAGSGSAGSPSRRASTTASPPWARSRPPSSTSPPSSTTTRTRTSSAGPGTTPRSAMTGR